MGIFSGYLNRTVHGGYCLQNRRVNVHRTPYDIYTETDDSKSTHLYLTGVNRRCTIDSGTYKSRYNDGV